jgi:U4/U6 small nuclear ribonucleoprotein PRP3
MVIVEGGPKGIKAYKKLMLRRIDWNDMPAPKNAADLDTTEKEDHAMDGENVCYLVWTGQVKTKAFKKFTWRAFESEKMARLELTKWHAENYWDAALMATDEELAMRQPDL